MAVGDFNGDGEPDLVTVNTEQTVPEGGEPTTGSVSVLLNGRPTCPWACGGDNDGEVGIVDLLALLAQWGGPGSCDLDGGGAGITDLLELLANWGPCP